LLRREMDEAADVDRLFRRVRSRAWTNEKKDEKYIVFGVSIC
jgi:hypothetical protein